MPEYIFIVPGFLGWTHLPDADGASVPYVPESRLLAAEARVREVEAERDVLLLEQSDREKLWQAEVDEYDAANATLRAERDALVPLARYALWVIDTADYDRYEDWVHQEAYKRGLEISGSTADPEMVLQARAILAREVGA